MQADIISRARAPGAGRALVAIATARGLCEAVTFTILVALIHLATAGRDPIALWPTALGLLGVTLVLGSVLRERGTAQQSVTLTVVVIGAFVVWGLQQPTREADGLAVLSRIVGLILAGEVYLFRLLGIARGLQRWRDVRDGALLALGAIVVASFFSADIDAGPLPTFALVVVVAGAVALSLARSTEELSLLSGQVGSTGRGSATGAAFAIGLFAVALAFVLPAVEELVARVVATVGPLLGDLLFLLLLPLGYVAAYFVYLVIWLRDTFGLFRGEGIQQPQDPDELFAYMRSLEQAEELRPWVIGALEILVILIAVALAILLIARLMQEKRALLPEGVSMTRESITGIGLRATLGSLFPRRGVAQRAPSDDGTRAAAIRRMYWRLLELAERGGAGWREDAETPAEHERRLLGVGERWRAASEIVRAFESVRYGEREPDEATVSRARQALRSVESAA